MLYYLFSVKQKDIFKDVKDIFIDGHRREEQQKDSRLKNLNFDKTFEDITENELDFYGYGTAKIEIQH